MSLSTKQKKKIRNRFSEAVKGQHVIAAIFQPCGEPDTKDMYRGRIRILVDTACDTTDAHTTRLANAAKDAVRGILRSPEIAVTRNPASFQAAEGKTAGKPFVLTL